jgi:hypothetical protein
MLAQIGAVVLLLLLSHVAHAESPAVSPAAAPPFVLMAQVKDKLGTHVTAQRNGVQYNVYQRLPDADPRFAATRAMLLGSPTIRQELELLEAAKRYQSRGNRPWPGIDDRSWRQALDPVFHYSVDGSYEEKAWMGFVLRTAAGDEDHLLTPFMEIAYDPEEPVERLQHGVAHEIGHLIFYIVAAPWILPIYDKLIHDPDGKLPCPSPNSDHDIQRVTGGLMALNEGMSQHFMAMDHLHRTYASLELGKLESSMSAATARRFAQPRWHRVPGILANRYVFEPLLPARRPTPRGTSRPRRTAPAFSPMPSPAPSPARFRTVPSSRPLPHDQRRADISTR